MTGAGAAAQLTFTLAEPVEPLAEAVMVAVPAPVGARRSEVLPMPPEVTVVVGVSAPMFEVTATCVPSRETAPMLFRTVTRTLTRLPQTAEPGTVTDTCDVPTAQLARRPVVVQTPQLLA